MLMDGCKVTAKEVVIKTKSMVDVLPLCGFMQSNSEMFRDTKNLSILYERPVQGGSSTCFDTVFFHEDLLQNLESFTFLLINTSRLNRTLGYFSGKSFETISEVHPEFCELVFLVKQSETRVVQENMKSRKSKYLRAGSNPYLCKGKL